MDQAMKSFKPTRSLKPKGSQMVLNRT